MVWFRIRGRRVTEIRETDMDQQLFTEIMPISIFLPRQKRFDFFIFYNKRGGAGIQKTKISIAASRHFDADPAFHFGADPDPDVHSDADPDVTDNLKTLLQITISRC
jgi:hypothetical protein